MSKKSVLIIGLEPSLVDYATVPHLNAEKVWAGLKADEAHLNSLGYDAELCMTDRGETAEGVVAGRLRQKRYDCVLIGAGVRTLPNYFLLFEKLINVVHAHAPQAKLCFNTKPTDTAEAVQRWL